MEPAIFLLSAIRQNPHQDRVQFAQRQLDHPARLDDEGRLEA
jgi:hypothetical protein